MINQVTLLFGALMLVAGSAKADRPDDNLQRMLEAARQLEFPEMEDPQNRAWLLEKLEAIRSPVAVVFGYADNEAGCREMAGVLSASGVAGSFECTPIY